MRIVLNHLISDVSSLRKGPVYKSFLRILHEYGIKTLPEIVMRGAGISMLIVAYVTQVLSADVKLAADVLVSVVFREVAPLLTAILVIVRSGTAFASEIVLQRERGEIETLRQLGIPSRLYITLPSVAAFALSTAVLVFYFQIVALSGGMAISGLFFGVPLKVLVAEVLSNISLWDLAYSFSKGLIFGAVIGQVLCAHAIGRSNTGNNAAQLVSKGVMRSILFILLINTLLTYAFSGVAFFGLVHSY